MIRAAWIAVSAITIGFIGLQLSLATPVLVAEYEERGVVHYRRSTGAVVEAETVPLPMPLTLRIEHIDDHPVSLSPPMSPYRGRLDQADLYTVEGDWRVVEGRWVSEKPGSVLTLRAHVSGAEVGLGCAKDQGIVCLSANGGPSTCHNLRGRCEPWTSHVWKSERIAALIPTRGLDGVAELSSTPSRAWLEIGNLKLSDAVVNGSTITWSPWLAWQTRANVVWQLVLVLLRALVLVCFLAVIGAPFAATVLSRLGIIEAITLAALVGFGLVLNVATTVNYVAPLGTGLAVSVVLSLLVAAVRRQALVTAFSTLWRAPPDLDQRRVVITALLGAAVLFFPAGIEAGWYAGQAYTDAYDYASWAHLSLLAPINHGLGAIRFTDFDSLGLSSLMLGLTTRAAYAPHHVAFWFLLVFSVFSLASPRKGLGAALVAAHATIIFTLASQCYMPQYIVVILTVGGIFAVDVWIRQEADRPRDLAFAVAAVFAGGVALYPYQAFAPAGLAIALAVLAWRRRSLRPVRDLIVVGVLTAVICQVNLQAMFVFGATNADLREGLNALGRYTVFPFYREPLFFGSMLSGARDLVGNSAHIATAGEPWIPRGVRTALIATDRAKLLVAISVVFALGSVAGVVSWLRRGGGQALITVGSLCLLTLVPLYYRDEAYFAAKIALSLAGFAVVGIALAAGSLLSATRPLARKLGLVFVVLFVVVNLRTALIDAVPFFVARQSMKLIPVRTALPAHSPELRVLVEQLEALDARFVIVGRMTDHYFTSNDRIAYNRVLAAFDANEVRYADGDLLYMRGYDPGSKRVEDLTAAEYVLVWRGAPSGWQPPPQFRVVLAAETYTLYRRQ